MRGGTRSVALGLLVVSAAVLLGVLLARRDELGVDAFAYWSGARTWLTGGDPYDVPGGALPYVYAVWALPLFAPWAILPWEWAWGIWQVATIALLVWSVAWAFRRRPLSTALAFVALSIPIGINLDTGNITLLLALALWGAQFAPPAVAGLAWALATGLKLVTAPLWLLLGPAARGWGLAWLVPLVLLYLAAPAATEAQVSTIAAVGRPFPFDYLVLLWAGVPWLWRRPELLDRLERFARGASLGSARRDPSVANPPG